MVDWCFSRAVGGLVSRKPSPNEKWGRNPLPPGVRRPINLKVIRTFWEDFLGGVILPVWHPMTSFRTAWTALLVPFVMVSQEVGEVPWKRINPISGWVGNISERARFLHMILVPRCQKNTWEWELSTLDHLQNLLGDVLSACHSNCCGQILLVTWLPFQREMYQVSALCQYNSSTLAFFLILKYLWPKHHQKVTDTSSLAFLGHFLSWLYCFLPRNIAFYTRIFTSDTGLDDFTDRKFPARTPGPRRIATPTPWHPPLAALQGLLWGEPAFDPNAHHWAKWDKTKNHDPSH